MWSDDEKRTVIKWTEAAHAKLAAKLPSHLGATLIIHDASLSPDIGMALSTTLPSRAHVRVLLADAVVGFVQADGGTPGDAGDVCLADAAAVLGAKESS
jgi:hypothetical protein